MSGAAISTIGPQRPPCNSQGLQGRLRSVQRPEWHCQAEETPKGQGGHSCWCPLSSVSERAGPEYNSFRSCWIKSSSLARGVHGRALTPISCSSWGQCGCGIQKQWCRVAGSARSVCHMSLEEMNGPGWDGCPQLGRMSQGGFKGPLLMVPLHIWHLPCVLPPVATVTSLLPGAITAPSAVPCESCLPARTRQRQSSQAQEGPLCTPELSASRCLLVGIHQRVWPLRDRLWQAGSCICCGSCEQLGHHHLQR